MDAELFEAIDDAKPDHVEKEIDIAELASTISDTSEPTAASIIGPIHVPPPQDAQANNPVNEHPPSPVSRWYEENFISSDDEAPIILQGQTLDEV